MKDLIQDVLDTIRFKSAVYFKHGFCGNWGMDIPSGEYAQFHLVVGGTCVLSIDEHKIDLTKGDLVVFPKGYPHQIKANKDALCKPGQSVVTGVLQGNTPFEGKGTVSSTLVCGHYELDRSISHFILADLPKFIIIKNEEYGRFDMIDNILNHILEELTQKEIGHKTVVTRLAEVLFIYILRHYYSRQSPAEVNLFKDEAIYKAVNHIHNNIGANLNIETLSRCSGISRTLFIQRFKNTVGNTPLAYIKNWRLIKAKYMLLNTNLALGEIGERIGYSNTTAFNRVFKNTYNTSPNKFRNQYNKT